MPRKLLAAFATAIVFVGVGISIASGDGSESVKSVDPVAHPEVAIGDGLKQIRAHGTASVDPSVDVVTAMSQFSGMRGPATPIAALGEEAARQANIIVRGEPFRTHTLADRPDFKYYVLVTSDSICTLQRAYGSTGGGCGQDMTSYVRGGMGYAYLGEGRYRITGLLPDSAERVEFVEADGSSRVLDVKNNLVTDVVKPLPLRAEWKLADGSIETMRFHDMTEPASEQTPDSD